MFSPVAPRVTRDDTRLPRRRQKGPSRHFEVSGLVGNAQKGLDAVVEVGEPARYRFANGWHDPDTVSWPEIGKLWTVLASILIRTSSV